MRVLTIVLKDRVWLMAHGRQSSRFISFFEATVAFDVGSRIGREVQSYPKLHREVPL